MTVPIVIKRQQEEINEIKQRLDLIERAINELKKKPGRPPKENNAKT